MNLRYYFRGLGIGIFVTAIVLNISASGRAESLSDEEIREKARALGMTEDRTVLNDLDVEEEGSPEAEGQADGTSPESDDALVSESSLVQTESLTAAASLPFEDMPQSESSPIPSETPVPVSSPVPSDTPAETPVSSSVPDAAPLPVSEGPITAGMGLPAEDVSAGDVVIKINSGEGSYTVCSKLVEAGLIESASDYDAYLCKYGYDKKMRVGSHTIPIGSDEKTIADILSRNS